MLNRKLFETKGIKEVTYIFSGYIIPKGWKVLTWSRAIHMDPTNYLNPEKFNPSRWNVSCIELYCII